MTGLLLLVALLGMILVGIPMVAAVGITVVLYLAATGGWELALPQQIVAGMNGFILLALPLFILAGNLMNVGGLSMRLFDFARALVGSLRGGMGHVTVVASMFFSGITGSSAADIAGVGTIVIPAMKREGYTPAFSAALTSSATGVGPLIPPSSPMILYSAITGASLGALLLAGLIPGILLGVTLMIVIAIKARLSGWESTGRFSWRHVGATAKPAALALGMPVIILAGMGLGIFTPTESAAFAVVYALLVSAVIYRSLTARVLYRAIVDTAVQSGEIMFVVGVSVALGWALSNAHVPEAIAGAIDSLVPTEDLLLRVVAILVVAIVAGLFVDPLIPVVVPIVLPTLIAFHVDLIWFGVLITMCVVIGQVSHPGAISLAMTSKIARTDMLKVFAANTPFLIAILVFTGVILLFPPLATWLPELASGSR